MRKKGIALVLVLALALTLVGVAVATDPTSNLKMQTSKDSVDDRDTFTVTVSNKAATFNALTFYVEFPTEDLTVKSVTWKLNGEDCCGEPTVGTTVVAGGCSSKDEANGSGKIGFYYLDVAESGDGKAYAEGDLQAVITFQTKEIHTEGKDRFTTDTASITLHEDSEGENGTNGLIALLNQWLSGGKSEVSFTHQALKYVLGDLTGDFLVNEADGQRLYEHLTGTNSLSGDSTLAADVTGDGIVNEADGQRLYEHLTGTNRLPG